MKNWLTYRRGRNAGENDSGIAETEEEKKMQNYSPIYEEEKKEKDCSPIPAYSEQKSDSLWLCYTRDSFLHPTTPRAVVPPVLWPCGGFIAKCVGYGIILASLVVNDMQHWRGYEQVSICRRFDEMQTGWRSCKNNRSSWGRNLPEISIQKSFWRDGKEPKAVKCKTNAKIPLLNPRKMCRIAVACVVVVWYNADTRKTRMSAEKVEKMRQLQHLLQHPPERMA